MILVLVITYTLLESNPPIAFLFAYALFIMFLIFAYKYRFFGYKKIALSRLPDDPWILRSPRRKIRLIVVVTFIAVVSTYAGIIFVNLMRR